MLVEGEGRVGGNMSCGVGREGEREGGGGGGGLRGSLRFLRSFTWASGTTSRECDSRLFQQKRRGFLDSLRSSLMLPGKDRPVTNMESRFTIYIFITFIVDFVRT